MNNKIVILLGWLIFPLILQFDNHLSLGQLGTQEKLNGIWEKHPGGPNIGTVHLNQEGDIITSTFEPVGGCWPDMFLSKSIPTPDEYFYKTKLDFSGKLIGSTIQAKSEICLPSEGIVKSGDLRLTVSDDGRSLIGSIIDDDGQTFPIQYFFKSSLINEPLIEVNTLKPSYNIGDQVGIFGRVTNMGEESKVFIQVKDPAENPMPKFSGDVPINSDGSFKTSFDFKNIVINGTYTAFAIYPNATGKDSADFEYGLPSKGFNTADMGVASGAIAALGAGGIFLYKHGYFKRIEQLFNGDSQNQDISDLPVIYVGIECGLENPELPKKEIRNGIETQDIIKLEQRFSKAVDDILKNRKVIKNVQKDIHFIKWCKEAKENPSKILSKLSNDIINKFLSSISPYFGNLILSELRVESGVSVTRDRHKSIKKSIQFNLVPIEPYIEFVLYINSQRISSAKFIFTIETNVEVKNLTVNTKTIDTQVEEGPHVSPEQNYGKKVSIENLIFMIAVEFSSLKIGLVEKNISPPIIIGRRKVEVRKFGFSDH